MYKLKYFLLITILLLPLSVAGQGHEVYSVLTHSLNQSQAAMNSLLGSITNLTEVYRNRDVNTRKRFVLQVQANLAQSVVSLQSAQEYVQQALQEAHETTPTNFTIKIEHLDKQIGETKLKLSEAVAYSAQAQHETNSDRAQADLQELSTRIESSVKQLDEVLEGLREVVEE